MNNLINQKLNLERFNYLLQQAKIIDFNYPLAAMIWMPFGYKILNINETFLNNLFEKFEYERYLFPFLVSYPEFDRINKKICSFEKGIFRVSDSVMLRPSGESVIYPMFKQWIKTENDLPIRVFQIGSMFRKGRTRGFLRPNENDFFVEAHTAFSSKKEAEAEILNSNKIVEEYMRWMAIPTLKTIRPIWTNKPVAEKEYAFDVLLPTGETSLLNVTYSQMQIFSKAFDISFLKTDGITDYTYQTEFGFSQRAILTSIWLLSTLDNLFLLPTYAPTQVVIIQIDQDNFQLSEYTEKIFELLKSKKIRVQVDKEKRQLFKRFTKYEKIGIPIRIEVGENELKNESIKIVQHNNKEKINCQFTDITNTINQIFNNIITDSYTKNEKQLIENITACNKKEMIREMIDSGKIIKMHLCYCESCVNGIQDEIGRGEVLGFEYKEDKMDGTCIKCDKITAEIAYYARRV